MQVVRSHRAALLLWILVRLRDKPLQPARHFLQRLRGPHLRPLRKHGLSVLRLGQRRRLRQFQRFLDVLDPCTKHLQRGQRLRHQHFLQVLRMRQHEPALLHRQHLQLAQLLHIRHLRHLRAVQQPVLPGQPLRRQHVLPFRNMRGVQPVRILLHSRAAQRVHGLYRLLMGEHWLRGSRLRLLPLLLVVFLLLVQANVPVGGPDSHWRADGRKGMHGGARHDAPVRSFRREGMISIIKLTREPVLSAPGKPDA